MSTNLLTKYQIPREFENFLKNIHNQTMNLKLPTKKCDEIALFLLLQICILYLIFWHILFKACPFKSKVGAIAVIYFSNVIKFVARRKYGTAIIALRHDKCSQILSTFVFFKKFVQICAIMDVHLRQGSHKKNLPNGKKWEPGNQVHFLGNFFERN